MKTFIFLRLLIFDLLITSKAFPVLKHEEEIRGVNKIRGRLDGVWAAGWYPGDLYHTVNTYIHLDGRLYGL